MKTEKYTITVKFEKDSFCCDLGWINITVKFEKDSFAEKAFNNMIVNLMRSVHENGGIMEIRTVTELATNEPEMRF